jgi:glutaredoxin
MTIAFCPDCEEGIGFRVKPKLGQRIQCPHCDADLEVINVSPLELDWAYDEPDMDWEDEEDWEEEDWEEEDEEEDEDDGDL